MRLEALTPMLRTWDLRGSVDFYCQVLGFECRAFEESWGWASLRCGGVSVMFSGPNRHEGDSRPCFSGSLYFYTDDVDGLWQGLKDKARVSYPIEDFDYGMREFGIYDNNGYLLQFGQEKP